mgnify:FL=1
MAVEALTGLQIPRLFLRAPNLAFASRGAGERVLVWPGFGAGDVSTLPLRSYLSYLGYRPTGWGIGRNNGDVLALLDLLRAQVVEQASQAPVTIIGWSLGGYLAREVARDCPELVRRVITLGSPVVGGPKYTAVAQAFAAGGDSLDVIEALVEARYQRPLTVPVTAVYSKLDGVVAWRACIDDRSPNVEHVEVTSTHLGLGFAADVLEIIANRLVRTTRAARSDTEIARFTT